MAEQQQMQTTVQTQPNGSLMKPILFTILSALLLVGLGVGGFLLYKQFSGPEELDSDKKVEQFIEDAQEEFLDYGGYVSFELDGQLIEIDVNNKVAYLQIKSESAETYIEDDMMYAKLEGQWYKATAADFNVDPDDIFDIAKAGDDKEEREYKGIVECPHDEDLKCYEIYIEESDTTTYYDVDTKLPLYSETDGEGSEIRYKDGDLEVPKEVKEEAISLDEMESILNNQNNVDSLPSSLDPEFTDEELDEYYQQLLEELESMEE